MSKFTIVLQGPLHQNTIPAAKSWAKFGRVIISSWANEDDAPHLRKELAKKFENLDVRICFSTPQALPASVYNRQNVYLQCLTSYTGLYHVDTEFAIKARADTFIGNPEPFIIACMAFPDRYVCSNLHFRPDATFKFHASDKFIGGATKDILNTFQFAKERCERDSVLLNSGIYDYTFKHTNCPYAKWEAGGPVAKTGPETEPIIGLPCELPHGYVGVYPEVILSTSYLLQKGIEIDRKNSKQLMRENFWVVPMEECVPYSNKDGWPNPEHNWNEIHHINQL